jgi:uncharacterized alkaline shock family protein YloU
MTEEENRDLGKIEVSPQAIASIVAQAVLSTYGIVGIAPKNFGNAIAYFFRRDARHGLDVRIKDEKIYVDVHVIVEYGTRITSVANSVMNLVKFTVEKAVGAPVAQVNVHVQGLRISDTD